MIAHIVIINCTVTQQFSCKLVFHSHQNEGCVSSRPHSFQFPKVFFFKSGIRGIYLAVSFFSAFASALLDFLAYHHQHLPNSMKSSVVSHVDMMHTKPLVKTLNYSATSGQDCGGLIHDKYISGLLMLGSFTSTNVVLIQSR